MKTCSPLAGTCTLARLVVAHFACKGTASRGVCKIFALGTDPCSREASHETPGLGYGTPHGPLGGSRDARVPTSLGFTTRTRGCEWNPLSMTLANRVRYLRLLRRIGFRHMIEHVKICGCVSRDVPDFCLQNCCLPSWPPECEARMLAEERDWNRVIRVSHILMFVMIGHQVFCIEIKDHRSFFLKVFCETMFVEIHTCCQGPLRPSG